MSWGETSESKDNFLICALLYCDRDRIILLPKKRCFVGSDEDVLNKTVFTVGKNTDFSSPGNNQVNLRGLICVR